MYAYIIPAAVRLLKLGILDMVIGLAVYYVFGIAWFRFILPDPWDGSNPGAALIACIEKKILCILASLAFSWVQGTVYQSVPGIAESITGICIFGKV